MVLRFGNGVSNLFTKKTKILNVKNHPISEVYSAIRMIRYTRQTIKAVMAKNATDFKFFSKRYLPLKTKLRFIILSFNEVAHH